MTVQQELKKQRESFKRELKIYCRINKIAQRSIAEAIDISDQEFHNMLAGFQASVRHKQMDFDSFKAQVFSALGIQKF